MHGRQAPLLGPLTSACRQAPLSQGRIVDGSLVCSYHGWSFGTSGTCNKIPQLPASGQAGPCASKRSCAKHFPVMVDSGVLFVWLDNSPEGLAESKMKGVARAWGRQRNLEHEPVSQRL